MAAAKSGDKVHVHYTGTLANGEVFDSSRERDPLAFTLGKGDIIEGFDEAVTGMQVGDSVKVDIPPEKAYGHREDERVIHAPREELPEDAEVSVGDILQVTIGDQEFPAPVVAVDEAGITLDLNPPLAGETLTFEIELMAIEGADA